MQTKYGEGERFRVVKEGARFEGLLLFGEQSISGWSRNIKPGEVLTCLGWKEVHVFGACVAGIMWTGLKVPDNAMVMQVWPFESLFRPFPLEGLLEPYVDPDDEDEVSKIIEQMNAPREEEIEDGTIVDLTSHLPEITRIAKHEDEDELVDISHL